MTRAGEFLFGYYYYSEGEQDQAMSAQLVRSNSGNLDVGSPPKKKQKITKWVIVKIVVIAVITISLFFVGHYAIPSAPLPPGANLPTIGMFMIFHVFSTTHDISKMKQI